jgi:hypothetical protein
MHILNFLGGSAGSRIPDRNTRTLLSTENTERKVGDTKLFRMHLNSMRERIMGNPLYSHNPKGERETWKNNEVDGRTSFYARSLSCEE